VLVGLWACARPGAAPPPPGEPDAAIAAVPQLGAHWDAAGDAVDFRVASGAATRVELWLYDQPTGAERSHVPMALAEGVWSAHVAAADAAPYYGYRVWGPNWTYDPAWQPGSQLGWLADVDADGNRMNPNKLVFDPYARELSHDPTTPAQADGTPYAVGTHRALDSAAVAPKGIVLHDDPPAAVHAARALRDELIYEVHLRGFTKADAAAGACAGTYAGAATRAAYLAQLGVTAIEFLPIQETQNDRNDVDPASDSGDNYWGYSTLAYFAPDRRYACDQTAGGPTREVRAMVDAFHAAGIEVYLDVVYNHTAEGGGSSILSLRGLDNAGYYQLDAAGTGYTNSNGVGADVAGDKPLAANLIVDSLHYWRDQVGIDGFRFDLAPVLGNTCGPGCFAFDPQGLPARIARELPGVPLIAEPWGVVANSYEVGNFPAGWSEWNDQVRDGLREDQNQAGVVAVKPSALVAHLSGSPELYAPRGPTASIDYLVSHDGLTLNDLYACNGSNNAQAWPYGPSDGGRQPRVGSRRRWRAPAPGHAHRARPRGARGRRADDHRRRREAAHPALQQQLVQPRLHRDLARLVHDDAGHHVRAAAVPVPCGAPRAAPGDVARRSRDVARRERGGEHRVPRRRLAAGARVAARRHRARRHRVDLRRVQPRCRGGHRDVAGGHVVPRRRHRRVGRAGCELRAPRQRVPDAPGDVQPRCALARDLRDPLTQSSLESHRFK